MSPRCPVAQRRRAGTSPMRGRAAGAAGLAMSAALLAGCVIVPRTTSSYDPACQQVQRRVELEPVQVAAVGGCRSNAECGGLLAVAGVTVVASAVVSGSIAIVGNVVFWLEEVGQCAR